MPLAINEIQADKDYLRAQFAMSIRRLEISMQAMRAKAGGHKGEIGRQSAEISRLNVELDKKNALIAALRTREAVHKSIVRRIAKILLTMYMHSSRRKHKMAGAVQAPSHAPNLAPAPKQVASQLLKADRWVSLEQPLNRPSAELIGAWISLAAKPRLSHICFSRLSAPEVSALPGASSMLSFFTTPSSTSIA